MVQPKPISTFEPKVRGQLRNLLTSHIPPVPKMKNSPLGLLVREQYKDLTGKIMGKPTPWCMKDQED